MIIPIILSGGSGSRLWPLSKKSKPKQFIEVNNDKTMFTETIERLSNKEEFGNPIILTNKKHKDHIDNEIKKNNLSNSKVILEPEVKSTAPAIASITEYLYNKNFKDDVIVIISSDAYIKNNEDFQNYLIEGKKIALQDKFVCFGVQPTTPETGYGYIKLDKKIDNNCFLVERFVEKPNLEKAIEFLKTDNYLWNTGIFMCKVSILRDLFLKFQKDMYKNIELLIQNSIEKDGYLHLNDEYFKKLEEISIDFAIIENLDKTNLSVISMNLIWSDLGSFSSLYDININKDLNKNVLIGDVILNNTNNCYIKAQNKTICCSDVENLIIIEDENVIMIIDKNKSQNVKEIIKKIKEKEKNELL